MESGIDKKRKKPNFLIVGAAKSGTTSIVKYLDEHPDILVPKNKELRFFIKDIVASINDEDPLLDGILEQSILNEIDYFNSFKGDQKLAGEASVHYLYHYNEAIRNIKKYLGEVRIIIILRNPTIRAISNIKFLEGIHNSNIEEELELEESRISNNYNSFWYYKELGLYYRQVKAYIENFSNVKVLIFEEFVKDPQQHMSELLLFLGLRDYNYKDFEIHNKSNTGTKLFKTLNKLKLIELVRKNLGDKLKKPLLKVFYYFLFKKSTIKPKESTILSLNEFYREDIKKLENLLNRELGIWYKKNL